MVLSGQRYYRTAPNSITKIYFNYTVFIRFREKVYFDGFAGLGFRVGGGRCLSSNQSNVMNTCVFLKCVAKFKIGAFITNALRYNFVN